MRQSSISPKNPPIELWRGGRGIASLTAFRWINELGTNCKSFEEVVEELTPKWGGYLVADGKTIFIQGKGRAVLLIVDVDPKDIPMAQLWRSENREGWKSVFIPRIDRILYSLQGVVINGDLGLWGADRRIFPEAPHPALRSSCGELFQLLFSLQVQV